MGPRMLSNVLRSAPIPLEITALQLGPYGTNCYVVHASGGDEALVVDPGEEPDRVRRVLRDSGLRCVAILVTHGHIDHIGAVGSLARADLVPVYISRREAFLLESINDYLLPGYGPYDPCTSSIAVDGGDRLTLAGLDVEAIDAPGHSPGALVFRVTPPEGDGVALVGDVLFAGSVGRTDLPGGDWATLERSIVGLYDVLPDDMPLLPGHGPPTTLARERATNPFLDAVRARG